MKRILLIGVISLLLTGCGSKFGKGASFSCSGTLTDGGYTFETTYYAYMENDKIKYVDRELNMRSDDDADKVCALYKEVLEKNSSFFGKDAVITCEGKNIYIEKFMTDESNSKLKTITKDTYINTMEQEGLSCK